MLGTNKVFGCLGPFGCLGAKQAVRELGGARMWEGAPNNLCKCRPLWLKEVLGSQACSGTWGQAERVSALVLGRWAQLHLRRQEDSKQMWMHKEAWALETDKELRLSRSLGCPGVVGRSGPLKCLGAKQAFGSLDLGRHPEYLVQIPKCVDLINTRVLALVGNLWG